MTPAEARALSVLMEAQAGRLALLFAQPTPPQPETVCALLVELRQALARLTAFYRVGA